MPNHRKYEKVERWDHADEIDGMNIGTVHIQEKVDGANAQVFQGDDGYIYVGSRTRILGRAKNEEGYPFEIKDGFRGLCEYVFNNKPIRAFLLNHPKYILYGEWLVKHTVNYPPQFRDRFWIFDVFDREEDRFLSWDEYFPVTSDACLDLIYVIGIKENPSMDELLDLVRKEDRIPESSFGAEVIEGLVFKNYAFVNKYGRCAYMKATTKDFQEVHHAVMGATRRDPPEVYLIAKYQTPARMDKIFNKTKDDHTSVSMRNTAEFIERVLHDLFIEEAWNMFMRDKKVKNASFNMKSLRKISSAKSKNWLIAKLQEELGAKKENDPQARGSGQNDKS